jgi:hypothetical protein
LEPKGFELLQLLVSRRPAAVSKQEIRDRVWPQTFVSESTLSSLVAQVRKALDDSGKAVPIRTVHGFGYAFEAEAATEPEAAPRRRATARLEWEGRILRIVPGENILGRGEELRLRVDVPGVSRQHARIVADQQRFTIEDLGSKNGTFVGETRVSGPTDLADRDIVRLGHTEIVFRIAAGSRSTATES